MCIRDSLGSAIIGYNNLSGTLTISNADGFRVALFTTNSASGDVSLGNVTNITASNAGQVALTYSGQGTGSYSSNVTVVYGDSTNLAGALANVSSNTIAVTATIYDHASGSLSTNAVNLGSAIVGYNNLSNSLTISNADGFRVALFTTNSASGDVSLGNVTNVAASNAGQVALTYSGQGTGSYSSNVTVVYGDSTNLALSLIHI